MKQSTKIKVKMGLTAAEYCIVSSLLGAGVGTVSRFVGNKLWFDKHPVDETNVGKAFAVSLTSLAIATAAGIKLEKDCVEPSLISKLDKLFDELWEAERLEAMTEEDDEDTEE